MVKSEYCCGCGACYNICPKKCITMEEDCLGFLYPKIDLNNCTNCQLCEKVCPSINRDKFSENKDDVVAFGGHCKDETIRKNSSSGGLFSLLALNVLQQGGCVFGAAFSNDCKKVMHIKVDKEDELGKLRGSKYVQSISYLSFKDVKNELLTGKLVLFSGTPCQVEGLKLFLGREYNNLITVELICHGVPSPRIFKQYIEELTSEFSDSITGVSFRDEPGGNNFIMKIITKTGKLYRKDKYIDSFYRLFLSNTCLRESCYQCPSRGFKKRADITLADFWGIEKVAKNLMDGKSNSILLAHSSKGNALLSKILSLTDGRFFKVDDVLKGNRAFYVSYKRPIKRDYIKGDIDRLSISELVKKYTFDCRELIKITLYKLNMIAPIKKILRK